MEPKEETMKKEVKVVWRVRTESPSPVPRRKSQQAFDIGDTTESPSDFEKRLPDWSWLSTADDVVKNNWTLLDWYLELEPLSLRIAEVFELDGDGGDNRTFFVALYVVGIAKGSRRSFST